MKRLEQQLKEINAKIIIRDLSKVIKELKTKKDLFCYEIVDSWEWLVIRIHNENGDYEIEYIDYKNNQDVIGYEWFSNKELMLEHLKRLLKECKINLGK